MKRKLEIITHAQVYTEQQAQPFRWFVDPDRTEEGYNGEWAPEELVTVHPSSAVGVYRDIRYGDSPSYHHPCEHYVYEDNSQAGSLSMYPSDPTGNSRALVAPIFAVVGASSFPNPFSVCPRSRPEAYTEIGLSAYRKWNNSGKFFSGSYSLLNFLIELKDMRGLLKPLIYHRLEFRRFIRRLKKGVTFAEAIRLLASGYLTYSFSIAPFIRDLQSIYKHLINFTSIWDKFVAYEGLLQTYNLVRKDLALLPPTNIGTTVCSLTGAGIPFTGIRRHVKSEYKAYLAYTYQAPGLESKWAPIKAFLDAQGIRFDAGIVWEAIPFSFVVDWFLNTEDVFSEIEEDNLPVSVTLQACSHHVRDEYIVSHIAYESSDAYQQYVRYFTRETLRLPVRDLPPIFKKAGIKQISLGAALLAQRL